MGCTGNQKEMIQSKILLLRLEKFDLIKAKELKIKQLEKLTGEKVPEYNKVLGEDIVNDQKKAFQKKNTMNQSLNSENNSNSQKLSTTDRRELALNKQSPNVIHLVQRNENANNQIENEYNEENDEEEEEVGDNDEYEDDNNINQEIQNRAINRNMDYFTAMNNRNNY